MFNGEHPEPPACDKVGIHVDAADNWPEVCVTMNPLGAWTLSPEVAQLFASGYTPDGKPCRGFILLASFPVERIVSIGAMGMMGNAALDEHIVVGGEILVRVTEVARAAT